MKNKTSHEHEVILEKRKYMKKKKNKKRQNERKIICVK